MAAPQILSLPVDQFGGVGRMSFAAFVGSR